MPTPRDREVYLYGERIRARLPRRLEELREEARFSKYGLSLESGVSREYLKLIETGEANPSVVLLACISKALRMDLTHFVDQLED